MSKLLPILKEEPESEPSTAEAQKSATASEQEVKVTEDAPKDNTSEDIFLQDTDEAEEEIELEKKPSHKEIWKEIEEEYNAKRTAIEEYRQSKTVIQDVPPNPAVKYLEDEVFPVLSDILVKTLFTAMKMECLKHEKSVFNGVDYIAENLWNFNPRHPERHKNPQFRFNMDWVQDILRRHPRPYFPFSYIWSRDFAATKIQAGVKGYWVRRRDDVQEMRQFWKTVIKEKAEGTWISERLSVILAQRKSPCCR